MGIIVSTTLSRDNLVALLPPITRKERIPVGELTKDLGVSIIPYERSNRSGISGIKPRSQLTLPLKVPREIPTSNTLWHLGWLFKPASGKHPNWSGYMQTINNDETPVKSDIHLFPIIDMTPTNETCIYSTLRYVMEQALNLGITTPCITFDQPLWLKAVDIMKSLNLEIVVRLGGFHMLMSFLGSIGVSMEGSGLQEVLSEIYAENVVPHLFSGKAIARALRGHFLVHAAQMTNLFQQVTDEMNNLEIEEIKALLDDVLGGKATRADIGNSRVLQSICSKIEMRKSILATISQTARLWIQYADYIDVVKLFITAARIGDWHLHLLAAEKMLNLFAATGHVHYVKSTRPYLQLVYDLSETSPWLYNKFAEEGYHTIRRSKRYWSGLWSDLAIEQVMLKSLKSRGGLTTGRGMTERVRHQWVHSMHRCSSVHYAMTVLTGLGTKSSEQHEKIGSSKCERDRDDMTNIIEWFTQHEPFDMNVSSLRSLSTGITATSDDGINCHLAEEVGFSIHQELDNIIFTDAKIKRSAKIETLASLYTIM